MLFVHLGIVLFLLIMHKATGLYASVAILFLDTGFMCHMVQANSCGEHNFIWIVLQTLAVLNPISTDPLNSTTLFTTQFHLQGGVRMY